LLVLTGALKYGAAAPPAGSPDPNPTFTFSQFQPGALIRLAAYGDTRFADPSVTSGTNPRIRKWLAQRIAEEHPSVLLLTGDTPYTGSKAADWSDFQDETAGWRANRILVLPATGNHEVREAAGQGIANYMRNFPQISGHRYYSALLGNVEVISLDCTSETGANSAQSAWFGAQLAHLSRQVQFLFILYHIPWVADEQSQIFANLPTKDALVFRGILEAHLPRIRAKVVVFNGHIHNYERFERRGVEYVVTGGGGAIPYPLLFRGRADLYKDTAFPVYHYLTIEVSDRQLHAVMWKIKDPNAATLALEGKDEFTLAAYSQKSVRKPLPTRNGAR
jgi:acid phosphatase type 7